MTHDGLSDTAPAGTAAFGDAQGCGRKHRILRGEHERDGGVPAVRDSVDDHVRPPLGAWLADKPALRELWAVKEALNRIYRIRGRNRAKRALATLTDAMAFSTLPELRTLR